MLYRFNDKRPFSDIEPDLERLRSLIRDLERIHRGKHPDLERLAEAPTLHGWGVGRRAEACLVGTMIGHPKIADGSIGATSGLWLVAPGLGYARSLNRFYRLGQPSGNAGIGRWAP